MVHSAWGIILAGGKSEQLTSEVDTPFLYLNNNPIIVYSLQAYERCPEIDGIIVAVDKGRIESVASMVQMFGCPKVKKIIPVGSHRQTTILAAMKEMDEDVTIVSIHEASRPFITSDLIGETIKSAKKHGSGVAAVKLVDPVKEVVKGFQVTKSYETEELWSTLTPQSYTRGILKKACDALAKKKMAIEDDSMAVERTKEPIHLVTAKKNNIKIRTPEDLTMATALAKL
ncbi:MAG: IspD/TarI family cytidylyltransferase [Lentisphaerota bacterium]